MQLSSKLIIVNEEKGVGYSLGKLFTIEGIDGSGKATQATLLTERLLEEGYPVKKVEFPNYKSKSSYFVKMYLSGLFGGSANSVDPYTASTFYALDRYATYKTELEEFYNSGGILIADRYTSSNMIHQASKISGGIALDMFLIWVEDFEYRILKIPQSDTVIFLDVPPSVSQSLLRSRRDNKHGGTDIHESDKKFLQDSYENALDIASKFNWERVDCLREGSLRTVLDIHEEVYGIIKSAVRKIDELDAVFKSS